MASPLISVIIPCHNASRWIAETLDSTYQQGLADTEVIVIDDGSTDQSLDIVRAQFPDVHTLSTENRGPSAARNTGLAMARGEFIQFLDADDRLVNGKWKAQLKSLALHDADIAYGDWQKCDEAGTLLVGADAYHSGHLGSRPELDLISDFWCPPAVYLFRRRIVNAVGGWNESLRLIEDVRYIVDCVMAHARLVYNPGIAAVYRMHAESIAMRESEIFMRCCLKNDRMLEEELRKRGTFDVEARKVLLKNYLEIARNSCIRFPALFEEACAGLDRLDPHFIPTHPKGLAWASRLLGYRRAEALAFNVRRLKSG